MLRRHGGKVKYHHSELGLNSRLDELQAAILLVKEAYLDQWTDARRALAARYSRLLSDVDGVITPSEIDDVHAVYHQYTIRVDDRDAVQHRLNDAGVGTAIYYPVPLYRQEVHARLGYTAGQFPQSEEAARTALSLPMFPELSYDQQDQVVETLAKALVA
jgi:dTDP-4-amino-4,6-dideoxygalactose transaminase